MRIDDPFGRVARRREREYESFRESLRGAGVTTRADADQVLGRIRSRGLTAGMVGLAIVAALVLLSPQSAALTLVFGAIYGLWLLRTSINGRRYLQRYVAEELSDAD